MMNKLNNKTSMSKDQADVTDRTTRRVMSEAQGFPWCQPGPDASHSAGVPTCAACACAWRVLREAAVSLQTT